ncbi:hypothetical protein HK104_000044 [Borealophlyctis nickersoniae]|nr:hypothetical protein HK104_000044 [Borealophlyctis nickersoniae]
MDPTTPILIVGGGIFGLTAAISLASRNYKVTILDRLPLPAADGSSNDINRIVRIDYGDRSVERDLALKAVEGWKEWNNAASQSLYTPCGILLTCQSPTLGSYEQSCITNLNSTGFSHLISQLSAADIARRFPALKHATTNGRVGSGYFNSTGGMVDANRTLLYLLTVARARGVRIVDGGEAGTVTRLLYDPSPSSGVVTGLETADGKQHTGTVVVCAGAWSASLVPQLADKVVASGQSVVYLRVPEDLRTKYDETALPVWTADIMKTGLFGFPVQDGLMKFACHSLGYMNPTPQSDNNRSAPISVPRSQITHPSDTIPQAKLKAFKDLIEDCFPELSTCPIENAKLCWYCTTFDDRFIISRLPSHTNLYVATGGSGHAFKFAPVLGDIIADVVEGVGGEVGEYFKWRENLGVVGEGGVFMPSGDGVLGGQEWVVLGE